MLRNSSGEHAKLKTDLQNAFTLDKDEYPTTCTDVVTLLSRYTKLPVQKRQESAGSSFATHGRGGGGG